ncbi:50S ribosomal protein L13 [Blattabacterium cuenoti]|uniref:50S ribosomal protein L13 n=1 Tax=Blattabacterium cuenoti TaxID=1653831 RepID=UPI00163C26E6|nr:50S ribosomal protein L13 [Blattabacterium cuenoti]
MDPFSFKTIFPKKNSVIKSWILLDAKDQILGRLSSSIAFIIMGKHKPIFSHHVICGDHVIVINSNNIKVNGKKKYNKKYIRYTGYPGGKKEIYFKDLLKKNSAMIIYKSVKGMLPKNRLSRLILKNNLHIYPRSHHEHKAQNPTLLKLNYKKWYIIP